MAKQVFQQWRQHPALRRQSAVFVVRLLPNFLRPCVHQHIARPGIKSESRRVRRQYADIGDTADIEQHAGFVG